MSLSAPVRGYKRKPVWIPFVAVLFMLTPFGNFLFTLANLRIPQWYSPEVWAYWVRYIPRHTWLLMGFTFLSGLSLLLFVRRWALLLTFVTLSVIAVYNLATFRTYSLMGTVAIWTMIMTTIGVAYFMFFTRFRAPYLNPKIRWWETSPRYRADIPIRIQGVEGEEGEAVLSDISITGALLEWPAGKPLPSPERVTTLVFPPDALKVPCQIARKTELGYGIRFLLENPEDRKGLKNWIRQLAKDPTKLISTNY